MKNKFYRRLISILCLSVFLIISCNESSINNKKNNGRKIPISFAPNTLINTMIDSIEGGVDAIQLFSKSQKDGISTPDSKSVETSYAKAIYFDADSATPAGLVKCNNNSLSLITWPIHYSYLWPFNGGPQINTDLFWETIVNNETIYDTIPIPNGFQNLAFTSDSLDLETGGTLTWNTVSSGDVAVIFSWEDRYPDGKTGWTNTSYYGTIPDNGSFAITPQVLNQVGVPDSFSKVASLSITLYKWNMKTKYYDSGNKQLITIALVDNGAFWWVVQK